jgi:hypothetical protein
MKPSKNLSRSIESKSPNASFLHRSQKHDTKSAAYHLTVDSHCRYDATPISHQPQLASTVIFVPLEIQHSSCFPTGLLLCLPFRHNALAACGFLNELLLCLPFRHSARAARATVPCPQAHLRPPQTAGRPRGEAAATTGRPKTPPGRGKQSRHPATDTVIFFGWMFVMNTIILVQPEQTRSVNLDPFLDRLDYIFNYRIDHSQAVLVSDVANVKRQRPFALGSLSYKVLCCLS